MSDRSLQGLRVAILVEDLFEQSELVEPRQALEKAGAQTILISSHSGQTYGMRHDARGDAFTVDATFDQVRADDFDAVLLPGGALNADKLRVNRQAQDFVRRIDSLGRPIAVICHGPLLLVSAGLVHGRSLTSYHTIQDDVRNAGGRWLDLEAVRDRNLVSSRSPRDLPAFNRAMIDLFKEYSSRQLRQREAA